VSERLGNVSQPQHAGGERRAELLASLAIEARRRLPDARALVVERGSEGWSVAAVLGPGGRPFGGRGTCRAAERAIATSFGLLVPHLPDVRRLTLDLHLEDPLRLGPVAATRRPTPVGRRQSTKQYRLLSTSKRQGMETRRYSDGSVVTVESTPTSGRPPC
jgi:hypothetical protein